MGAVVCALAGAGAVEPARAAEPVCEGVRLNGASELAPAWGQAVSNLRGQLGAVSDSGCAAVTLSVDVAPQGGARLAAMTADGRYAERRVPRPSALAATALGLIASIPDGRDQEPRGVEHEPGGASGGALAIALPPLDSAVRTARREDQVWLDFASGVRAGGSFDLPMLDFELRADALSASWLLTLSLRYGFSVGPHLDDSQYREAVVGAGLGRRARVGSGTVDVVVLPVFAWMSLGWNLDEADPKSGSSTDFRLALAARWATPISPLWTMSLTADADLAPSTIEHPIEVGGGAYALPVWTAGLRLGACGQVL